MRMRIGTRGSALALTQTDLVVQAIRTAVPEANLEVVDIKTMGCKKQGTPLASKGDKKDWIYELELGILARDFDLVVHSGKDVPTDIEKGTETLPVLGRQNPKDCFIGRIVSGRRILFSELPLGAKVGTASLRRKASLLRLRPDLNVIEHRGNVATRIEKLDNSPDIMGIVLACAGLERLNFSGLAWEEFDFQEMIPAINQGTLVVQFRSDRDDIRNLLAPIILSDVRASWEAERACCEVLMGDCRSCISIFASTKGEKVHLISRVMLPDGSLSLEHEDTASLSHARDLGARVGDALIKKGAREVIEKSRVVQS